MENESQINDFSFNGNHPAMNANETDVLNPENRIVKKSFLVYKHNKYIVVPTKTIAFFYIKYESTVIVTFDKHEYIVGYSLDQIQQFVSGQDFYRLNRQYLVNFSSVKEVEHWFARKLLVIPVIPFNEKLVVSKEKARGFLHWLENR
jgi:DNA-binding LytR/AlgR family response regulator